VLLDGNLKVESIDPENIKAIVASILEADQAAKPAPPAKSSAKTKKEKK
jgi:hypothetical protein